MSDVNEKHRGEDEDWEFIWQREYGAKRYFRHRRNRRVSVCDDSGDNPSRTEDGPLYLDWNRTAYANIDATSSHISVTFLVPVEDEHGKKHACSIHVEDMRKLFELGLWRGGLATEDPGLACLITIFMTHFDELEICEGVAGVWHYHLRKKGESRALCRAFVMPTKIPLSQWNRKIPDHHIPESYCSKCDALKDK